ncbi:Retrovirus-related Pol polyprotein from transposon [Aduncisulcus paluster]|uniref:Retrovirus-related Pol polyprotein from transposon n=1 Tax=Aduncisulcus paluster TaxID=2918883 RepID=A0ABQ5KEN3_9EUKA|nr:Retrovirus-related Pol polyprotein from transposon [Aduncisulcus paluster]
MWFATLDLSSGFHQVPIEPGSQHLTAFVTPSGIYAYKNMPFGLVNAPSHFQRVMNIALGEEIGKSCVVYIDDGIIFGKNEKLFLESLERVLRKISSYGMILNKENA